MSGRWAWDFTSDTPGAQPAGTTRRFVTSGGSFFVVAAAGVDGIKPALRFTPGLSTLNALSFDAVNSDPDRANFQTLSRWANSNATGNQDARSFGRGQGSGTATTDATFYQGGYSNGMRRVGQMVNGVQTIFVNSTADAPVSAANVWRQTRTDVQGNVLRSRTWLDTDVEPSTWDVTYTDAANGVTGPGWIGVYQNITNGATTWDAFAIATGGLQATFNPDINLTVTDTLGLTDPGSSLDVTHNIVVTDGLGLTDARVPTLVSPLNVVITDRINGSDFMGIGGSSVFNLTVVDSMDLIDDAIIQTLIPGDTGTGDPSDVLVARGVAIFEELIAAGFTVGTIMDRERARLLAKTGASPVGNTLQDLYFLANERPRL